MFCPINTKILYISKIAILLSVYGANVPRQRNARFSINSLLDTAVPAAIHPLVAAGSDRCVRTSDDICKVIVNKYFSVKLETKVRGESIKRFFGLTYEQLQEKSDSNFFDNLSIDFVTNKGNVKVNVTASELLDRLIDNGKMTFVLTHGFMESSDGIMVKAVASELLKMNDIDILALDGRKFVTLEYFRSTTYARFMGEKLGLLLSAVIKNGQDPKNITLIGHSLGAHIAGIAGKTIKKIAGRTVGRIIGLDPAGPCFINISHHNRLDRNDAAYVDVIHTNGGILGLKETIGDKDFYPNGGSSQPGCFFSTCDHSRAWEIFAETLNFADKFPARKCSNWTTFRSGNCTKNEIAFMGIKSIVGSPGSYYLTTNSSSPFGLGAGGS